MIGTWMTGKIEDLTVNCGDIGNCSAKTPDIGAGFTNIAHGLIGLVGGLALVFVIVSGLQMALSAGNAKRFQQGRTSLLYAVTGVALAILAYGIVSLITGVF